MPLLLHLQRAVFLSLLQSVDPDQDGVPSHDQIQPGHRKLRLRVRGSVRQRQSAGQRTRQKRGRRPRRGAGGGGSQVVRNWGLHHARLSHTGIERILYKCLLNIYSRAVYSHSLRFLSSVLSFNCHRYDRLRYEQAFMKVL